jgi:hypothetical protein
LFSPALDRLLLLLPPLLRAIQAPSTPLQLNNSCESEELKPIDSEMKSVLVLLRPILMRTSQSPADAVPIC